MWSYLRLACCWKSGRLLSFRYMARGLTHCRTRAQLSERAFYSSLPRRQFRTKHCNCGPTGCAGLLRPSFGVYKLTQGSI